EARSAEPVHRRTRNPLRQAGKQQRHARDVAIVLAGLVRAAQDDVVDRARIERRVALQQRFERDGSKIVGANAGQRTAIASERSSDYIADKSFFRHSTSWICNSAIASR